MRRYAVSIILLLFIFSPALSAQSGDVYPGRTFSITFTDLLGSGTVSTADAGNGLRGTLLVYWSVSCAPCLREIPELNALYREWAPRGVRLIGLPQDERPEEVLTVCGRFGIRWPQYLESGRPLEKSAAREWGITRTPSFILLDAGGAVIEYGFSDPRAALNRHF
jgi:thiol-disulfide isomerase/thioredoxin